MTTVRVHPRFVIPYYAFYLEGLGRVFGYDSLVFDRTGGPDKTEFDNGFAFTVEGGLPGGSGRRVYVSANDFARVDRLALAWSERYGIVNFDPSTVTDFERPERVVPIGPSFGVGSWGGPGRTARDIIRVLRATGAPLAPTVNRLRGTKSLFTNRLPERSYVPGPSRSDYVFFVGWPWKKHPEVNPPRARFMRACRSISTLTFEGGFAPRRQKDVEGIDDVTADRIYPFKDWLRLTRSSAVVFNCPAVHRCLGWKLGEFLALGKAIISLPLSREMPAPLVHGEHVHYVEDDQEAMRDAIRRLMDDREYRAHLEVGARRYYLEHLSPESVIRRLVFD